MELAKNEGVPKVVVEFDCSTAVSMIRNLCTLDPLVGTVVEDILAVSESFGINILLTLTLTHPYIFYYYSKYIFIQRFFFWHAIHFIKIIHILY